MVRTHAEAEAWLGLTGFVKEREQGQGKCWKYHIQADQSQMDSLGVWIDWIEVILEGETFTIDYGLMSLKPKTLFNTIHDAMMDVIESRRMKPSGVDRMTAADGYARNIPLSAFQEVFRATMDAIKEYESQFAGTPE